jgi:ribosome-associated translation inhibitor RaiA
MSDPDNSPARMLADRLRLGAGFTAEDRGRVLESLAPLGRHLAHWSPERVDLEISVKNRGGPEQKVTVEAWLPKWPSIVATATDRELDRALIDVRKELIRRIEDEKAKRGPHKARAPRPGRA